MRNERTNYVIGNTDDDAYISWDSAFRLRKCYHVHDSTYEVSVWFIERDETRSPTAMLDQLIPFWPGSF
jgi:hypothetical protein